MRLNINEEEVSYSLEAEKTLGEVAGGVRTWLAAAGFLITGMSADGRDLFSRDSATWSATGIASVKSLDVKATHTGEMRLAHWRTVDAWLAMIETECRQLRQEPEERPVETAVDPRQSTMGDLVADLPQTLEGIRTNPFLPPGSDLMKRFEALFDSRGAAAALPAERRPEALSLIRELRGWVQRRIAESTHPEETLARCAELLRQTEGDLREVSVLLQTGKDKPAMDIVIRFTDVARSLIDVLPFCAPDPLRARLIGELTPVLRDLVAAFDTRDSVLIGDLLEYEIAPRVEKLGPLLETAR